MALRERFVLMSRYIAKSRRTELDIAMPILPAIVSAIVGMVVVGRECGNGRVV